MLNSYNVFISLDDRIEKPSQCEYLLMPVGVQPGGVAILQTSDGQFVYYLVSYKHRDHI